MKTRWMPLWLCLAGIAAGGAASAAPNAIPLRAAFEPQLQAALEEAVQAAGLSTLVESRKIGVALVGITDSSCPRFASINGDEMMYAASLPKIGILLAALVKAQEGQLTLDDRLRSQLHRMIRRSSNRAATAVMRRVGPGYIARVLQSERYALYDPASGGGLWVGKEYAKTPAWKREPLRGLSHAATATQVARFYYLLETGQLLNPELTEEMRSALRQPALSHKFVKAIRSRHPGARFLRKSGTWRDWHADSAVVRHSGKRYIAVGLVQSSRGERVLQDLIVRLDDLVFEIPAVCPSAAEFSEPASP